MWSLWFDPNFRWVLAGSILLGMSSGMIGVFSLLRKRGLLGDVLAHAALPGVCVAFLATGTKEMLPLLVGAAVSGLLGTWCVDVITRRSKVKEETALGVVLTVFFGAGVVLLTWIQHSGAGNQSGLDSFLFGQSAAMVGNDVAVIAAMASLLLASVFLFFKEFQLLCFDRAFGAGLGLPMGFVDRMLTALIVLAVVIGLQAVGVVLMAALLITPGIAARYWTDRLDTMVMLSGLFGGLSGAAGTVASALGPRLPTGPLIVLAATLLFVVSLVAAPKHGLVAKGARLWRLRRKVARENLLRDIYEAYETELDHTVFADEKLLARGIDLDRVAADASGARIPAKLRLVRRLAREGLLRIDTSGPRPVCALTPKGLDAAWDVVRRHRLWEMFMMHEADLKADHVDRGADDIEHFLTPDLVKALERLLSVHQREPRLLPSVHPLDGDRRGAVS